MDKRELTISDEITDFLNRLVFDIEALQKAAKKGEKDFNYLASKYDSIERTTILFRKRLTTHKTALGLIG